MGELNIHNISFYKQKYGLDTFVETGTGRGAGLSYALSQGFDKLYSIEFMESLYLECKQKFTNSNVELLNLNSVDGLSLIIKNLAPNNRILYWLDAHFPGADFHLNDYNHLSNLKDIYLPLESELRAIFSGRDSSKDVFILDDLRIYEDGPYEYGNWDLRKFIPNLNLDFLNDIVSKTHTISKDMRHQGFLILTPK